MQLFVLQSRLTRGTLLATTAASVAGRPSAVCLR